MEKAQRAKREEQAAEQAEQAKRDEQEAAEQVGRDYERLISSKQAGLPEEAPSDSPDTPADRNAGFLGCQTCHCCILRRVTCLSYWALRPSTFLTFLAGLLAASA